MCDDCKRKEEEAKRPKIPPLKFHLGSSASPPQQKTSILPNESRKRKPSDGINNLPPMKKFKPVTNKPSLNSHVVANPNQRPLTAYQYPAPSLAPGAASSQNGMHNTIMTGPTLSPQGQLPSPSDNVQNASSTSPPPGLRSPPAPTPYTNGYIQHVRPQSGYQGQIQHSSWQTPYMANGGPDGRRTSHGPGWSMKSSPANAPPAALPVPISPNPFSNSTSSLPGNSQGFMPERAQSSPYGSHLSGKPPQAQNDRSVLPQTFPPPNLPHDAAGPLQAVPSPTKQQSSPQPPVLSPTAMINGQTSHYRHSTTSNTFQKHSPFSGSAVLPGSSSPINGPNLQQHVPSSTGFSPTKHSSPRHSPSIEVAAKPILPPAANLVPSPKQVDHNIPQKKDMPEPLPAVDG